jgi:hypothetical protein
MAEVVGVEVEFSCETRDLGAQKFDWILVIETTVRHGGDIADHHQLPRATADK